MSVSWSEAGVGQGGKRTTGILPHGHTWEARAEPWVMGALTERCQLTVSLAPERNSLSPQKEMRPMCTQ